MRGMKAGNDAWVAQKGVACGRHFNKMAAGVKLLSLPVEDVIIPHILSRLSPLQVWSLRLVSSQFYAIVYQYYATNCQDINFTKLNGAGHHDIKDDQKGSLPVVCRILAHCYRLRDLRLNGEYFQSVDNEDIKMGDSLLLSLNKTKPNLTVLQLEFLYLSRATLHLLKECCNYLKILILVGLQELELYDIISEEHSSLEELRLVDCSFPSNQLQKILMKQTELEIFQVCKYFIFLIIISIMYNYIVE